METARLLLRGQERDFGRARQQAVRWLARGRLDAADLPTHREIRHWMYALSGAFAEQHAAALRNRMQQAAVELMRALQPFEPRLVGGLVGEVVAIGSQLTIQVQRGRPEEIVASLEDAGFLVTPAHGNSAHNAQLSPSALRLYHAFPCEVVFPSPRAGQPIDGLSLEDVERLLTSTNVPTGEPEPSPPHDADRSTPDDAWEVFRMLLMRLDGLTLDTELHPEGDALYHTLQVFELGRAERPYDEEFLLACLLHDVGLSIDRRHPERAALEAIGGWITERTAFLIEHRVAALSYLSTGKIARSLRRSEHFDDLLLLARCDLDGRECGVEVPTLDEALAYVAGLETAWDDV